jgi:hypothetical protein
MNHPIGIIRGVFPLAFVLALSISVCTGCISNGASSIAPVPLLSAKHPVDWWFVFKLNSANFPDCKADAQQSCQFGGQPQQYSSFGQQFV